MKLAQLFENDSAFATMLLRLVKAGQPVFVNAKSQTYMTGSERVGFEPMRDTRTGWLIQAGFRAGGHDAEAAVQIVRRKLADDRLDISPYQEYAMTGVGTALTSSFKFETPIDEHYTIKKIDGVWTILDREQVTESSDVDDPEFMLKMAQRLAKKHGYEGHMNENDSLQFEYAGFTVLVFYEPDKNADRPWAVGWYKNGLRVSKLDRFQTMRMALADIFGHELVKEMTDPVLDDREEEQFALRMLVKKLNGMGVKSDLEERRVDVYVPSGLLVIRYQRNLAGNRVWRVAKVKDGLLAHVEFRDTIQQVAADVQAEMKHESE